MTDLKIYFAPGACSRVTLIALEECGRPYEAKLVRFMKGEHRSPEYLQLNPKGKVPLLVLDGQSLSENVAILTFLASDNSGANLLPFGRGALQDAQIISLLSWCSSGMHPIITRIRLPQMFCAIPEGRDSVRAMAKDMLSQNFRIVEEILSRQTWMLSEWSALDAYLYWIWFRAIGSGFDGSSYPHFALHSQRMEERPSVGRVLHLEAQAELQLAREGAPSSSAYESNVVSPR